MYIRGRIHPTETQESNIVSLVLRVRTKQRERRRLSPYYRKRGHYRTETCASNWLKTFGLVTQSDIENYYIGQD